MLLSAESSQEALRRAYEQGVPLQTAWITFAPSSDREQLYALRGSDYIDDVELREYHQHSLLRSLRAGELVALGNQPAKDGTREIAVLRPSLCDFTYLSFYKECVQSPAITLVDVVVCEPTLNVSPVDTCASNLLQSETRNDTEFLKVLLSLRQEIRPSSRSDRGRGRPSADTIILDAMIRLGESGFDFFDMSASRANRRISTETTSIGAGEPINEETVRAFRQRYDLMSRARTASG